MTVTSACVLYNLAQRERVKVDYLAGPGPEMAAWSLAAQQICDTNNDNAPGLVLLVRIVLLYAIIISSTPAVLLSTSNSTWVTASSTSGCVLA